MSSLINLSVWQSVKLSEVSIIKRGVLSSKTASITGEGDIPFIKAKDIQFDTTYNSNEKLPYKIIENSGVEIVPKNSLLIAVSGPTVGSIAILGTDAVVDNKIYYSIANRDIINPQYLYYYLYYKRNQIVKSSKYLDCVSFSLLSKLNVLIPPVRTQKRIAAELEKKIKHCDKLIKKVKKAIDDLNVQRHTILQKSFDGIGFYANENKLHFKRREVVRIKECGLVQAGKTPTGSIRQYFGKEFPFFNPGALEQGINIVNSKTYLSARGIQEARSFKANSILVCYEGSQFGKAGIARTIGACNSQMISITPHEIVIPEYLYFQIISAPFQEQMKRASQKFSISKVQFEGLYIELPSLRKQNRVVNFLNESFSALHHRESELSYQLQKVEFIKREALSNAFERVEV
ncbi:MAG: restriction endonuclease subunit S [Segetibacter sp.]